MFLHSPPHGHEISKRKQWQRISAYGHVRDHLCKVNQYLWVPVIPQELGGINSPLNEVLMSRAALRLYRPHFETLLRLGNNKLPAVTMFIDVTLEYGPAEANMAMGLQKPATILLKLTETESADEEGDDMKIIYN